MQAPIGFLSTQRYLQPRISPSRCLYALHHFAMRAKKRAGLPHAFLRLEVMKEFWSHVHWRNVENNTKSFGLVLGAYVPCKIMAVEEHGSWHTQVDSKAFDEYYGEKACYTAFMEYFAQTALGFDEIDIPDAGDETELDDENSSSGIWHPAMLVPEGELANLIRLDRFEKRRQRPGEKAAREAGKAALELPQLPVEMVLDDEIQLPPAPHVPGMAPRGLDVIKKPETIRDFLDAETNGRDPDTGAILRRVLLDD